MQKNRIVAKEEWLAARKALLAKEKEATRLRDKINAGSRTTAAAASYGGVLS